MKNSKTESPYELEELLNKGESLLVLERIKNVLTSTNLSKQLGFTYQILKCRALTYLSQHHHAIGILEEIWEDVFEFGTEIHKLDLLYLKTSNIRFLGKHKEAFKLNEDANEIIDKIKTDLYSDIAQREVLILLQKALIIRNLHGDSEGEYTLTKHVLSLCDDYNYEYGKALALRQMAKFLVNTGNTVESLKQIEKAIEISERNQFKEVLADSIGFLGEFYAFTNPDLGIQYLDKAKQIGKEIGYKSITEGIHHSYGIALSMKNEPEIATKHFEISLNFYKESGNKAMQVITLHNIAQIYQLELDYDKALSILYEALAIAKEIETERRYRGILNALVNLFILKGELNRAHKFLEENINFFRNRSDSKVILTWARNHLGRILLNKGDLEGALDQFLISLNTCEKEYPEDTVGLRTNLCNVAEVFQMKGDNRISLNHFLRSLQIGFEKGPDVGLDIEYFGIISNYIEMKELKEAKNYLEKFQNYSERVSFEKVQIVFQLSHALYLKANKEISKIRDATTILQNILSKESLDFNYRIVTILNLCECYIAELKISNNDSLLNELNLLIEKLQEISVSELTYPLLIQSYRFQAQIALLELDVSKARALFDDAQSLAEEKGIELLALKISNEHDLLLEKLEDWENFTQRLPAIAEIMGLTHIESALEEMIKRKGILVGDSIVEEEDPCFFVISNQAGSILFVEQFKTEINKDIINQFSKKIASREVEETSESKIERLVHQDFTYLLKQLDTIVICYAFIGKSYNGIKKLKEFSSLVQQTSQVWDILKSVELENQSLDTSSRITLSQFVDKIFIYD
ncbi:MAG: tetratricopeptide repeat protein [Asgard group archaeon]|nr:tetratricopeptide repeat protein [Asgard group archaeon]